MQQKEDTAISSNSPTETQNGGTSLQKYGNGDNSLAADSLSLPRKRELSTESNDSTGQKRSRLDDIIQKVSTSVEKTPTTCNGFTVEIDSSDSEDEDVDTCKESSNHDDDTSPGSHGNGIPDETSREINCGASREAKTTDNGTSDVIMAEGSKKLPSEDVKKMVSSTVSDVITGKTESPVSDIQKRLDDISLTHTAWKSKFALLEQQLSSLALARGVSLDAADTKPSPSSLARPAARPAAPASQRPMGGDASVTSHRSSGSSALAATSPAVIGSLSPVKGSRTVKDLLKAKRNSSSRTSSQSSADCIDLTSGDDDVAITAVEPGTTRQIVRLPPGLDTSQAPPPDASQRLPPGTMLVPRGMALVRIPDTENRARLISKSQIPPDAVVVPTVECDRVTRASYVPVPKNRPATTTNSTSSSPQTAARKSPSTKPEVKSQVPAPLPAIENTVKSTPDMRDIPPPPELNLDQVSTGVVLSWKMDNFKESKHASVSNYQLFAYSVSGQPKESTPWKKVGDLKALPLPMACTLIHFQRGETYHFAVRAVDKHSRIGPFSTPKSIDFGS